MIDKVQPNTPAAAAGLRARGHHSRLQRHPHLTARSRSLAYVETHGPASRSRWPVDRGGENLNVTVTPEILPDEKTPRIGIRMGQRPDECRISHPTPLEQVYNSVTSTLNTIGAVASPKSDVKLQHLSGPVGIVRIYYLLFESERGWQLALWFSVILNVNLAILNMLPIPVLDGGHIVLALVESVRRKPVNIRVLEIVQTACAVLIIGYMLYITFFDVRSARRKTQLGGNLGSGSADQPNPVAAIDRPAFPKRGVRALLLPP